VIEKGQFPIDIDDWFKWVKCVPFWAQELFIYSLTFLLIDLSSTHSVQTPSHVSLHSPLPHPPPSFRISYILHNFLIPFSSYPNCLYIIPSPSAFTTSLTLSLSHSLSHHAGRQEDEGEERVLGRSSGVRRRGPRWFLFSEICDSHLIPLPPSLQASSRQSPRGLRLPHRWPPQAPLLRRRLSPSPLAYPKGINFRSTPP